MNLNIWDIMAPAFFECLILVGIHSYLGLHVIRRKVIFVDLALAQIAALGTTVGFLFGIMPGSVGAYWFSLLFTVLGAAIFSITRLRHEKIPQEAVIGLVYALAAAIVILVIDKAPHGAEHIKEILTGSILWVRWATIGKAALVYGAVGIFHYIFRDKFLLISDNPEEAYNQGLSIRFWDFLFYFSFGVVITHSVGTAGVLLVFVFLVVPAITAMLITDRLLYQLLIGWGMGLLVSIIGLYISYVGDLPSGPTVVAFYGFMLLLVALYLYIKNHKHKMRAIKNIGLGLILVFLFYLLLQVMASFFKKHELNRPGHENHIKVHEEQIDHNDLSLLDDTKRDSVLMVANVAQLKSYFESTSDDWTRLQIVDTLIKRDKKESLKKLIKLLKISDALLIKSECVQRINQLTGMHFHEEDSPENIKRKLKIKDD